MKFNMNEKSKKATFDSSNKTLFGNSEAKHILAIFERLFLPSV